MSIRIIGGTAAQCQCHCHYACCTPHNSARVFQIQSQRPPVVNLGKIPTVYTTKTLGHRDQACKSPLHPSLRHKHVHFGHLPPKQHQDYAQKPLTYPEPLDPRFSAYKVVPSKTVTLDHTTVAYPISSRPQTTHLPTLYILTFSTLKSPLRRHPELLASHLPIRTPPIPHLYTLDCTYLPTPPEELCATYSGVAQEIQDIVLRNIDARNCVRAAVDAVLGFWRREVPREEVKLLHTRRAGRWEVAMSVCCPGGTHRSVAVAEAIAWGVRDGVRRRGLWAGEGEGVRVVCRHLHRVKGWGDPL